jgi:hypothetical protein
MAPLYELWPDRTTMAEDPMLPNGEYLEVEDAAVTKPVTVKLFKKKSYLIKPLADCLWTTANEFLIISPETLELFKSFKCDPSFAWVPTDVISPYTGNSMGRYYSGAVFQRWDIVDPGKSEFEMIEDIDGNQVPYSVSKWVIDRNKIPPLDLFRSEYAPWFISPELYEAIQQQSLTGFKLKKMPVG